MMHRGLSPAALERVRDQLSPGGRVVRVRPLHGGVSSSVHLVHLSGHDAVIVRRYRAYAHHAEPLACEREFRLLGVLSAMGQPVPMPLLLDAEGGPFGAPTIVMSRVLGRPLMAPRDVADYLRQMAETLVALHALPLDQLEFLPEQRVYVGRALRAELTPSGDELHAAVWEAAQRGWRRVSQLPERRALVHGDYWPGNLLWRRGRLIGIIDWEQPRLGDPSKDVATCRGDLNILLGPEAGDAFLRCYLDAGGRVDNLEFWEQLVATWAIREVDEWARVYPLMSRPDITPEVARERVRAFAARALTR
jgi:aminoglycoside phosphotransferase (APT) family kinase protein